MATLANAALTINLQLPQNQAQVRVTGEVRFNELEMSLMRQGLRFRLDCLVWGEDWGQGNWLDPDDFLFSYPSRFFPDASPTAVERFSFERTVPKNVLNEDAGTDEIYGDLTLVNLASGVRVKRKTNVISHQFA